MSGGIRIPVSASLDAGDVSKAIAEFEARFNALGAKIAAANKVTFDPIKGSSIDHVRKLEAAYKSLLKVSGDLRQRTQSTGQQGRGFLDLDWERMYPAGPLQRNFRQQQAFEFVGGPRFSAPPSNGGGGGGRPPNGGNGGGNGNGAGFVGGVVRQVAGAGLNAMGAAGRVANGALGAGMSGGVMAGLAGLGGGLAALAIGKAVGAVVEKSAPSRSRTLNTTGSRGS